VLLSTRYRKILLRDGFFTLPVEREVLSFELVKFGAPLAIHTVVGRRQTEDPFRGLRAGPVCFLPTAFAAYQPITPHLT